MQSSISYSLNINTQSSNAHNIRPVLPNTFAENDVKRTITINKIASATSKKNFNHKRAQRLASKLCFLPLTPTIVKTPSIPAIDIQSKLGNKLFDS